MKGNVNNLVTLCLDRIDCDRLALRHRIEENLGRLEKQTLINRNGDVYFFLTNEERDISKEIKQVDLSGAEESSSHRRDHFRRCPQGAEKAPLQRQRQGLGLQPSLRSVPRSVSRKTARS